MAKMLTGANREGETAPEIGVVLALREIWLVPDLSVGTVELEWWYFLHFKRHISIQTCVRT